MRVLFLGNNWVGWQIADNLKKTGAEVVGLVLHKASEQKFGHEIREVLDIDEKNIFYANNLKKPETIKKIRALAPQIGVSAFFGSILKPDFLEIFPKGCVNIHPALLPFNRGAHPNIWSIVNGTPCGVTIHYMDKGVDTGEIIAQQKVEVEPTDTGKTLYHKLEKACVDLFEKTWPLICQGQIKPGGQYAGKGTYHRILDLMSIKEIMPNELYTAKELIDIIRSQTFKPFSGAYMKINGKKVCLRLELFYEHEET